MSILCFHFTTKKRQTRSASKKVFFFFYINSELKAMLYLTYILVIFSFLEMLSFTDTFFHILIIHLQLMINRPLIMMTSLILCVLMTLFLFDHIPSPQNEPVSNSISDLTNDIPHLICILITLMEVVWENRKEFLNSHLT